MELTDLKKLHDKAYNHGCVPREQASDDLLFANVTQWDDNLLGESQLQYRGQFDIIRKARRQILGDLRGNPIQVDFQPVNETRTDAADLLDGIYRASDRFNMSLESYENAQREGIDCGVGAWELFTEYESLRSKKQVIRRRPIYEACNNVFWDPNAKFMDKSDADYVSILYAYSEDAYKALRENLTGDDSDNVDPSFAFPEESYTFPWTSQDKKIYVVKFYHRKIISDKVLTFEDMFGERVEYYETDIEDVEDDLIDQGYELIDEEVVDRYEITLYIGSGSEILAEYRIPGENIPVVPYYGERAFVEGEEYYEGITRLAKDPQRLRNFQMSYLADIVSRSPRPKPIFNPEQIQGFEDMYDEAGSDNNYPYLLQNSKDANGNPLPIGPVAQMPEQTMPQALVASIGLSREAVEDVANPGLPQDIADPDVSGKAVLALQNRVDQQSIVYQQNMKHAKRRDGEIYASMAREIYDQPRKILISLPDGENIEAEVMQQAFDKETGEMVTLNDLSNAEFEVYSDIGPSYATKKEQTLEMLSQLIESIDPADPMRRFLLLEMVQLVDGVKLDNIRDYAKKELLIAGLREPESEEDEMMLAQLAQQGQEPDANMVLAMAEQTKADAQMLREQRQANKDAADVQNNQVKNQIEVFKAQTDRMNTQIDAQEARANINNKNIDSFGKQIDNAMKVGQSRLRASVSQDLRAM